MLATATAPCEPQAGPVLGAREVVANAHASRTATRSRASRLNARTVALRTALVVGSVAAAAIAWVAASGSSHPAEPDLALLLRGMAALKGLLAVVACGVTWWRLGQPVATRVAASYIACVATFFASTALIWQLAFIPAAAVLFHASALVALVLALREGSRMPAWQSLGRTSIRDSTAVAAGIACKR